MYNFCKTLFVAFLVISISLCAKKPEGISKIVPEGAVVEKVSKDITFGFTEGPAWDRKGNLFFTDIPNRKVYKLDSEGNFSVFRDETGAANGLMFNASGNLVACEGGDFKVTEMDQNGKVINVLAEEYNGKPFNSPNDLVIDKKGGIYFTDPRFGENQILNQDIEAVYYIKPDGEIIRIAGNLTKPNGIILSPDEKILYIADTYGQYVKAFDVMEDGSLANSRNFCELKLSEDKKRLRTTTVSGADGMTIDKVGNLYVTTRIGIQIFGSDGEPIGIIEVPEIPANCSFGGEDYKTLYITARTSVYKVKLNVEGIYFPQIQY